MDLFLTVSFHFVRPTSFVYIALLLRAFYFLWYELNLFWRESDFPLDKVELRLGEFVGDFDMVAE